MNKRIILPGFAYLSLALLFSIVVIHLRFVVLPVAFLALGFLSYSWDGRKALALFLFLLPLINSTPDVFFNGYPFNYMGIPLFYLAGMMLASRLKKEKTEFEFPGCRLYLLFLLLIAVSVFFVFLRWSNLTISMQAFLPDTPVAPSGERVSFAVIFPAITLALFSLSPFLAGAIRFWRLQENEIFIPLKTGFCLSFLLALVQKWMNPDFMAQSWWGVEMKQVNGGFSDFNAFGFFAGAMFFYQSLRMADRWFQDHRPLGDQSICPTGSGPRTLGADRWWLEILFLAIALASVFISGCRTAFLFVLLAVGYLLFSRKTSLRVKALVILLLLVSLLSVGGTLKKRLQQSVIITAHFSSVDDQFQAANEVSSGRLAMLRDGARMIKRFPVSGVGAGNFLFYLKYLHFNQPAYMDLPLNQYLLFFSEIGLTGGLIFILFLAVLLKRQKGGMRPIMAVLAFALLFNNFFWFPECFLLFWIFLAKSDFSDEPGPALRPVLFWAVLAVFVVFQLLDFGALHPQRLNQRKKVAYDYGFWLPETNQRSMFSWTRGAAGKYIFAGREDKVFEIVCAAPSGWLRRQVMIVDLYWQGEKIWPQTVFSENGAKRFILPQGQAGFLEIRVHPTFNIKELGLGADGRELGVQFLEIGKSRP